MSAKIILIFCAQALFVQSALSQCTSRAAVADRGFYGGGYGLGGSYGLAGGCGWDAPYGYGAWGYDGAYGFGGGCGYGGLGYGGLGYGGLGIDFSPTSGGGLPVSSGSAIAPVGLTVASENVYEGILAAAGELPFVGTVGVEGVLPTAGAGAVNHHCGDGINAMASDNIGYGFGGAYGAGYGGAYGLGLGGLGLGYRGGWAGRGCGCGGLY